MPSTTHKRSAALAAVSRLLLAAERHKQGTVDTAALRLALAEVDVEGLANPRPQVRRPAVEQARASLDGQRVTLR